MAWEFGGAWLAVVGMFIFFVACLSWRGYLVSLLGLLNVSVYVALNTKKKLLFFLNLFLLTLVIKS